jgi:p-aminobenzoyl-glutamate transporter AbgT
VSIPAIVLIIFLVWWTIAGIIRGAIKYPSDSASAIGYTIGTVVKYGFIALLCNLGGMFN